MSVPSVNGVKPCGSLVLVEHLTDNEIQTLKKLGFSNPYATTEDKT